MQGKARQSKAKQGKARQGKVRQGKARQGKARQGEARQGKARQGKARQGKARQGKSRQGKAIPGQHQGNTRVTRGQGQEARPGGKARNDTRGRPQKGREKIVGPRSRGYFDPPAIYRRSWSRGVFFGEIKKKSEINRPKNSCTLHTG
jgi:hypothetical protein